MYSGPSTTVARPKSPSFSDLVPSGYSHTWTRTRSRVKSPASCGSESAKCGDKYQQVLRLDVPVDDVDAVQVLQRSGQVAHHDGGVPLGVFGRGGDGIEQISALRQR